LYVHLRVQSILRRLHPNSLVMQHGLPMTKKMPSDVANADSLCRGLERFKRLVGVNRTRSEAVQEQPVILTRAPGPPPKLDQPLPILVCQENRTMTTVRFGRIEPAWVYGLYHPKACAVPVYRAPAKGKQLAYANAADTNQPLHCTVRFREFVKQTRLTRQLALFQFEETVPMPVRGLS
jgi:hypothetical protein